MAGVRANVTLAVVGTEVPSTPRQHRVRRWCETEKAAANIKAAVVVDTTTRTYQRERRSIVSFRGCRLGGYEQTNHYFYLEVFFDVNDNTSQEIKRWIRLACGCVSKHVVDSSTALQLYSRPTAPFTPRAPKLMAGVVKPLFFYFSGARRGHSTRITTPNLRTKHHYKYLLLPVDHTATQRSQMLSQ